MNTLEKLEFLKGYYEMTRQSGHTTAMIEGAKKSGCVVITHDMNMADLLKRQKSLKKNGFVSIRNLDSLRGSAKPIIFDNCALHNLFLEAISEIRRLQKSENTLGEVIKTIKKSVEVIP